MNPTAAVMSDHPPTRAAIRELEVTTGSTSSSRLAAQTSVREQRIDGRTSLNECRDVFAECGPHLEAVPGAATDEPHVVEPGMPVDEEVPVARGLVLAHARFDEWCVRKGREPFAQNPARRGEPRGARRTVQRGRIHLRA